MQSFCIILKKQSSEQFRLNNFFKMQGLEKFKRKSRQMILVGAGGMIFGEIGRHISEASGPATVTEILGLGILMLGIINLLWVSRQ